MKIFAENIFGSKAIFKLYLKCFVIAAQLCKQIKDPFLCVPRSLGVCLYRAIIVNLNSVLSINKLLTSFSKILTRGHNESLIALFPQFINDFV